MTRGVVGAVAVVIVAIALLAPMLVDWAHDTITSPVVEHTPVELADASGLNRHARDRSVRHRRSIAGVAADFHATEAPIHDSTCTCTGDATWFEPHSDGTEDRGFDPCPMWKHPEFSICTLRRKDDLAYQSALLPFESPAEANAEAHRFMTRCHAMVVGGEWPYYGEVWAKAVPGEDRQWCEAQSWRLMVSWLERQRDELRDIIRRDNVEAAAVHLSKLVASTVVPLMFRVDSSPNLLHPMHNEMAFARVARGDTNCDGTALLMSYLAADVFPNAHISSVDAHGHVMLSVATKASAAPSVHMDPMSNLHPWTTSTDADENVQLEPFNRKNQLFQKVYAADGRNVLSEPDFHATSNGAVVIIVHPAVRQFQDVVCSAVMPKDVPRFPNSLDSEADYDHPIFLEYLHARADVLFPPPGRNHNEILLRLEEVGVQACDRRRELSQRKDQEIMDVVCKLAIVLFQRLRSIK